ncbi:MAG: LemA family protein, partial [Minisyncoccales bacterium]
HINYFVIQTIDYKNYFYIGGKIKMDTGVIIVIIAGIIVLFVIILYNSLVSLKNQVKNSWAQIDVQLKRRADLIPNLINTVKGYAKHEKELLTELTKARTQIMSGQKSGDINKMAKGENALSGALKSVFAVAENYPNLKANENFKKLQEELSETENQIAAARRIYNENVTYFNTKIETFPNNILANSLGFKQRQLFEATDEEKKNVKVEF